MFVCHVAVLSSMRATPISLQTVPRTVEPGKRSAVAQTLPGQLIARTTNANGCACTAARNALTLIVTVPAGYRRHADLLDVVGAIVNGRARCGVAEPRDATGDHAQIEIVLQRIAGRVGQTSVTFKLAAGAASATVKICSSPVVELRVLVPVAEEAGSADRRSPSWRGSPDRSPGER